MVIELAKRGKEINITGLSRRCKEGSNGCRAEEGTWGVKIRAVDTGSRGP